MNSSRHEPWVQLHTWMRGLRAWHSDIADASPDVRSGRMAAVYDGKDEFVGWGWVQTRAELAVRLVTREEKMPDEEWWIARARDAVSRRRREPGLPLDPARIFHGEADDFPGLVVDRIGSVLLAEAYTAPMAEVFLSIAPTLHEELGTAHHVLELDGSSARAEGAQPYTRRSPDCPTRVVFDEHGVNWEVFPGEGHKTGFFLDQRENRARLREYVALEAAAGRAPEVLDVCCYTGGFALNAASAGAAAVTAVDLDEKAIAAAQRHANRNQLREVKFTHADAYSWLRQAGQTGRSWDMVIVDPPKFIPNRHSQEEGRAKYHDINKLAIAVLRPGGLLLTCSCSGLLAPLDFQELVRRAAKGRPLRILRETGAPPDHPVRADFPEGRYLKAIWARAD
ncbi:MAG: class I SAM-dependent rRNA methyltransferase [Planctomycetota bacterium]|nr:class I SAM-dependent rRNA methyltransferase [Planctomycetota bacterium]